MQTGGASYKYTCLGKQGAKLILKSYDTYIIIEHFKITLQQLILLVFSGSDKSF